MTLPSILRRTAGIHVTLKEPTGLPQTGDDGNIWLWVIIGLSSILAGLCVLLYMKRGMICSCPFYLQFCSYVI